MRWLVALVFAVIFAVSAQAETIGDWMTFRWGDLPASVAASKILTEAKTIDRSPEPQNDAEIYDPNGIVLVTAKYAAVGRVWDASFGFRNGRLISVKLTSWGDIREAALDSLVALYGAPTLHMAGPNGEILRWRDSSSKNFVMCSLGADGNVVLVYRPLAAANVSGL